MKRELEDGDTKVLVSDVEDEYWDNFDTGEVQTLIEYKAKSATLEETLQLRVFLSKRFIQDLYNVESITEDMKKSALLDIAVQAYNERGLEIDLLEYVRGNDYGKPLRYARAIDFKSTNS